MKINSILVFALLFTIKGDAQSSFQILLDSIKLLPGDFDIHKGNDFSGIFFPIATRSQEVYNLSFSYQEKKASGFKIKVDGFKSYDLESAQIRETEDEVVYLFQSHSSSLYEGMSLVYFNKQNQTSWVRQFPDAYEGRFLVKKDEILVFNSGYTYRKKQGRELQFTSINKTDGQIRVERAWTFLPSSLGINSNTNIRVEEFYQLEDGSLVLGGHFANVQTFNFFIAKIDPDGNFVQKRIFEKTRSLDGYEGLTITEDGEIYFMTTNWQNRGHNCRNLRAPVVIKYNSDFNLIWAKSYLVERIRPAVMEIGILEDGSPVFFYGGREDAGSIIALLDDEGNITSKRGIYTTEPIIAEYRDSTFLLQSGRVWGGNGYVSPNSIITKVDYLGNIANCESYETKLEPEDYSPDFNTFWDSLFTFSDSYLTTATFESVEYSFSDYCEPRLEPGEFATTDSLCLGDTIRTLSSYPANKNCIDWTLSGPGVFFQNLNSEEFFYVTQQPGTYTLRQSVYFIGQEYTYEKTIEVLPPLSLNILVDSIECEPPPTVLIAEGDRLLKSFYWDSGDTTRETSVSKSGYYSVTATDGFCEANTRTSFQYFYDVIDTISAFELPDGYLTCKVHLPFEVRPSSEYSNDFYNNEMLFDSVFSYKAPGEYQLFTDILGCSISEKFNIELADCEVEVYMPTAFSPNNDGINDEFIPMGGAIQPISMSIYDRWGAMVFQSDNSRMTWDGMKKGKPAHEGIYAFHFIYLNLLTELEEQVSGDVLLMR